jgi:hypothetical protein
MVGERQGNSMGTAGERHGNGRGTAWEQHGNGMVCVNRPLSSEKKRITLVSIY